MTSTFLTQSPNKHETTEMLASILEKNTKGRIFLLTGNFSNGKNDKAAETLLSLIEWAGESADRELVVLVGVFKKINEKTKNWELQTNEVAKTLAGLVVQSEISYMARKPQPPGIPFSVTFYAVEKWHAKAIGLTGMGGRFRDVQCAIFGSTNFSSSALYGENFELDLFMDKETQADELLLKKFIEKIAALLGEAKNKKIPGFNKLVLDEIRARSKNFVAAPLNASVEFPD